MTADRPQDAPATATPRRHSWLHSTPAGRWAFVLLTGFALTQLLWDSYSSYAAAEPGLAGWASVYWAALARNVGALSAVVICAAIVARLGGGRAVPWVFYIGSAGVAFILVLEHQVEQSTGNHLGHYLQFVRTSNAAEWAGGWRGIAVWAAGLLAACALGVAAMGVSAELAAGGLHRRVGGARHGPARLLSSVAFVVVAGGWLTLGALATPLTAIRVSDELLLGLLPDQTASVRSPTLLEWETAWRQTGLADQIAAVSDWPPSDTVRGVHGTPRNIVLIVCESLRSDLFSPEVMPRLARRAEAIGHVAKRHSAGSNASHFGLHSLLSGRHPLAYWSDVTNGRDPLLPAVLRRSGYELFYLSVMQHRGWMRMEQFVTAPRVFDEIAVQGAANFEGNDVRLLDYGDDWPAADRAVLDRATGLLTGDRPRLVVVFLASTHFPYRFPPDFDRFRPSKLRSITVSVPRSDRDAAFNAYRNAAGYLDAAIDDFIAGVDLSRSIVVVTSDHGESFYEDGVWGHFNGRLSDVQCRVPLVMFGLPGGPQSTHALTTHADVAPTLLAAIDPTAPLPAAFHGDPIPWGLVSAGRPAVALTAVGERDDVTAIDIRAGDGGGLRLRWDRGAGAVEVVGALDASGVVDPTSPPDGSADQWLDRVRGAIPGPGAPDR